MSAMPASRQRGLSVVETLVGLAIGLFIVGGALKLFADHLGVNRHLLLEARVHQDLRASADLIARDLRRAGHWEHAASGVWLTPETAPPPNPHAAIEGSAGSGLSYSYDRGAAQVGSAGFRLVDGRIQLRTAPETWQEATDPAVLRVTRLDIVPVAREVDLLSRCAIAACPLGEASCPPRLVIRQIDIALQGQAVADARVVREIRETVRVRNDQVVGSCPAP